MPASVNIILLDIPISYDDDASILIRRSYLPLKTIPQTDEDNLVSNSTGNFIFSGRWRFDKKIKNRLLAVMDELL